MAMVVRYREVETDSFFAFLVSYIEEMEIETLCDAICGLPYTLFVVGGASDTIHQF